MTGGKSVKVLCTYNYGEEKFESIENLGYELVFKHEKNIINDEETDDADILVCYNPFEKLDVSKMKRLKHIQLSSIGIDQLPFEKLKGRNISVSNNKGGYSIPMGEWIVLKILEIYKNSRYFNEMKNERRWRMNTDILEIYGSTIGFLGTGTIAKEAAKRLCGFGVSIAGLNTKGSGVDGFDKVYSSGEIDEFLKNCDVLVVCLPHVASTEGLMDYEKLSIMKDDSSVINISRGSVIKEKDLIKKLEEGKFKGLALDVFENEPLSKDSRLWEFERVLISPHNSWISQMRNERRFKAIYENLKRYARSEELLNVVDIEKGY